MGLTFALMATLLVAQDATALRVLSAVGMRQVMLDLAPKFESATGRKLTISFDSGAVILKRLEAGETADVVMLPRPAIDRLDAAGKLAASSITDLATSVVGVAVRKGAPRPDVSSVAAFKRTLLAAKTIACPDPALGGSSGDHIAKVFERLGIADALTSKLVFASTPGQPGTMPGDLVAAGKAEIALHQIQELMAVPGIDIAGMLPRDLQGTFLFSAAIVAGATDVNAADGLIGFLRTAEAKRVIEASGMSVAGAPSRRRPHLRVFTTRAIATVLAKIGPQFERASGYTLSVTTDIAIRMVRRIQGGEPFDFIVAAPAQIDDLIKEGKVAAHSRTNLARSGIGVAVRAGAPKPDIGSVDAFKRTLLNAKSIAYLKEGQSGVYLAAMIERLGLAGALESKTTRPDTDIVSQLVARGEVELGMVVVTQILTTPGVALAGALPRELQSYIVFTAGVAANSPASSVASSLMKALTGPSAAAVMRSQGMEPWSDVRR